MKIGRNDPCHCGSGNKYKKCCAAKDEAARVAELAVQAAAAAAAAAEAAEAAPEEAEAPEQKPVAKPKTTPSRSFQGSPSMPRGQSRSGHSVGRKPSV